MIRINVRSLAGVVALATLFAATAASAQTIPANIIAVTSSPVTSSISPGTGVTLGTFTFGAPTTGTASIGSVPLTLTIGGSGSASNLSNCQVVNGSGQAVASVSTVASGSNTVTFTSPVNLTTTSGPTTFTVRCDVGMTTPSGSIFQFVAGAPTSLAAAATTTAPALGVALQTATSIAVGQTNQLLGLVWLDATKSGKNVNVTTVPLTVTPGNGASNSWLLNCTLRNSSNAGASLNTGGNAIGSFATGSTFHLDTPLSVTAGNSAALAIVCDVSSAARVGGIYTLSITPSSVAATDASTGSSITPTNDVSIQGLINKTSGTVTLSTRANTSGTGTTSTTTLPGIPNTGAGDLVNFGILAVAGLLSAAGLGYLRLTRRI